MQESKDVCKEGQQTEKNRSTFGLDISNVLLSHTTKQELPVNVLFATWNLTLLNNNFWLFYKLKLRFPLVTFIK